MVSMNLFHNFIHSIKDYCSSSLLLYSIIVIVHNAPTIIALQDKVLILLDSTAEAKTSPKAPVVRTMAPNI